MKNFGKLKIIGLLMIMCFSFFGNVFAYKELMIEDLDGKPIRVIKVVLDGQDFVITSVAKKGGDTLENLIRKVGGDSGINGTFFCPADYSYCGGVTHSTFERVYLGDGASYSASWPETSVRVLFGFDIEGNPFMAQNNYTDHDAGLKMNINSDRLDEMEFGMSNYTVLLVEGKNVIDINSVNFSSNMYSSANRNFICSTADGSTVYMGIVGGVSIPKLADYVQRNFGCYNALALDAGASEAMVYGGNVLARSSRRKIMDAFVVVDRETYIKLTGYTPEEKEPYIPDDQYNLTENDYYTIGLLDTVLRQLVEQEGSSFRNTEKKVIREAISMDKFKYNYQRKAIFHELLVRLFTVDKL